MQYSEEVSLELARRLSAADQRSVSSFEMFSIGGWVGLIGRDGTDVCIGIRAWLPLAGGVAVRRLKHRLAGR